MAETNDSQQNPTLTLSVTLQEVNVIISALQEISYKLADPVLKKIVPQAKEQLQLISKEQLKNFSDSN